MIRQWWREVSIIHRWLFIGILLLGIALRVLFINQPMRTDESLTYLQFASQSIFRVLADYAAPNNHIFHTTWVWLSTNLFGISEFAIRLPAFVAGIFVIPLTYIVTARLAKREIAIMTMGFVATAMPLIFYSTNARGYTLQTALLLGVIWSASMLIKQATWRTWAIFIILSALGFHTIPTMVYAWGGVMLWLLWVSLRDPECAFNWIHVFGVGACVVVLTALLYTPVFIVTGLGSITGNIYVQPQTFEVWVESTIAMLGDIGEQWFGNIIIALVIVFGVVIGLVRGDGHFRTLIIGMLLSGIGLITIQQVSPFIRVWILYYPVIIGFAIYGIYILFRPRQDMFIGFMSVFIVFQAGLIVVERMPYETLETGTFRDGHAIAERIEQDERGDNWGVIYEHPTGETLRYYFERVGLDEIKGRISFINHNVMYVVVNHEYPQEVDNIFRISTIDVNNYTLIWQEDYPRAILYRYEYIGD